MTLSDIIPTRWRYGIYVALVLAGVVLGTIQVWCTAAEISVPTWHAPALAVLGYLSAAVGLVAAANIDLRPAPVVDGVPVITSLGLDAEQADSLRELHRALSTDMGDRDPASTALAQIVDLLDPPQRRHDDDG